MLQKILNFTSHRTSNIKFLTSQRSSTSKLEVRVFDKLCQEGMLKFYTVCHTRHSRAHRLNLTSLSVHVFRNQRMNTFVCLNLINFQTLPYFRENQG